MTPKDSGGGSPGRQRWLLAAALAVSVLLAACGGGKEDQATPPERTPPPTASLEGVVVLPAGMPAGQRYRVATALGEVDVGSDGRFAVPGLAGGQIATVSVAGGPIVLMARLRPDAREVSVRSTAEALLYFRLGLFLQPYATQEAALSLIRKHAAFESFASAIGSALATVPDLGAPAVRDALAQAASALLAPTDAMHSGNARRASVLVQPGTGKSGIEVNQPGLNTIQLTNHYRRRAFAQVERVGFKREGEAEQSVRELTHELEVPPAAGLTSVAGALGDIVQGIGAYAPLSTGLLLVAPNPGDAELTRYRVTVLGCGLRVRGLDLGSLSTAQYGKLVETCARSYLFDFLLPLLATTVMELGKDQIERLSGYSPAALDQDAVALLLPFVDKVLAGDLPGALRDGIVGLLQGNAIKDLIVKQLGDLYLFLHPYGLAPSAALESIERFEGAIKLLNKVDALFTSVDSLVQIVQVGNAAAAETWDVLVTQSKVTLTPTKSWVSPRTDRSVRLTAKVVDADASNERPIVYRWTQTRTVGVLYDAQMRRRDEASFETLEDYVHFVPEQSASASGTDTVGVAAFLTAAGTTNRLPLGEASATVEVADIKLVVSPLTASNLPFEQTTLKARIVFPPSVSPEPGQRYRFRWWTTGRFGRFQGQLTEIDSGEVDGPEHSVPFKSVTRIEGVDRVVVEVLRDGDGLARVAESSVRNELRRSVVPGELVLFENTEPMGNVTAWCGTVHLVIPKVEGVTRYQVSASGFYDPYFYGNSYSTAFGPGAHIPAFDPGKCRGGPAYRLGQQWLRDRDSAYWLELTGASTGSGSPISGWPDWYLQRFHGIEVEVGLTY